MRIPRCGNIAASTLCPKVDVVWWSSSRVSRRCSCGARSMAVLKHTGMDGTMAPRVWISNTVTTSYGFLNTYVDWKKKKKRFNITTCYRNKTKQMSILVAQPISPGCSTVSEHAKWRARCRRIPPAADSGCARSEKDPAICPPTGPESSETDINARADTNLSE